MVGLCAPVLFLGFPLLCTHNLSSSSWLPSPLQLMRTILFLLLFFCVATLLTLDLSPAVPLPAPPSPLFPAPSSAAMAKWQLPETRIRMPPASKKREHQITTRSSFTSIDGYIVRKLWSHRKRRCPRPFWLSLFRARTSLFLPNQYCVCSFNNQTRSILTVFWECFPQLYMNLQSFPDSQTFQVWRVIGPCIHVFRCAISPFIDNYFVKTVKEEGRKARNGLLLFYIHLFSMSNCVTRGAYYSRSLDGVLFLITLTSNFLLAFHWVFFWLLIWPSN